MSGTIIHQDEYIAIAVRQDGLYIESYKKGFTSEQLFQVLSAHPQVDITNFNSIKNAINGAPQPWQKFGRLKERIEVDITDNGLKGTVTFNLSPAELQLENRESLIRELSMILKEKGIVFGIKSEILRSELQPGKNYTIAEGIPAVDGTDSIITMYKMTDISPEIRENGKANFYELKLINRVKSGDWLGEKTDATDGIPGQSVTGKTIAPVKGRSFPLVYDKNSVLEVPAPGKTILYSKSNGAVNYVDGKITVSNHLDIDGNVDFKTGNIKFDGFVSIRGTVSDGFSVEATRDIEINSDLGLGNIKEIISTRGSIFIKGGIASRGKSEIKASKDVYAKFIDNARVVCGGSLHIGFYCVNSNVEAQEVIFDSIKGHIVGGHVKAKIRVVAPVIGTDLEKRTIVEISGFNREAMRHELDSTFGKISELKNEQQRLKQLLAVSDTLPSNYQQYMQNHERLLAVKDEIKALEETRKNISAYLTTKGEGEICITKKIFPNCQLILQTFVFEIHTETLATSFYIQDGQLKQS